MAGTRRSGPHRLQPVCHLLALANIVGVLLWLSGSIDPVQRTFFFSGHLTVRKTIVRYGSTRRVVEVETPGFRETAYSKVAALDSPQHEAMTEDMRPNSNDSTKVIVWWNKDGRNEAKQMCEPYSCTIMFDRERASEADAVVVEFPFIDSTALARDIPVNRPPRQAWVFYNRESPSRVPLDLSPISDVFNITWTYRNDSDIYQPYGIMVRKTASRNIWSNGPMQYNAGVNYAAGKTKMVAWMVSNCKHDIKSRRMEYAKELQKYVQVDIYGKCGTLSCGDHHNKTVCYEMLQRDYKFYLSFENALCKDYITEKFWRYREAKVVPIVLGAFDTSKLPHKTAIDVRHFKSVKYLANYLKLLDLNDTLYNEYFAWENNYKIRATGGMCKLCQFLHQNPDFRKVYNMSQWWNEVKDCVDPREYFKGYEESFTKT